MPKATQSQAGEPTLESRHDDEGFRFSSLSEQSTLVESELHHFAAVWPGASHRTFLNFRVLLL